MFYESIIKSTDHTSSKKIYRFDEEDLEIHDVPTTLGDIFTLSDLFDAFIIEARHNMIKEKLDPFVMPDGVHKELNTLLMSAAMDINRISVHNMSNIMRVKPFTCDYVNRVMTVSVPISFVDIKVFTDYKINAGFIVLSEGRIMGRVAEISLYLTFSFDFMRRKMIFREFGIPNCDQLSVQFKGEGLTKYLLNILTPAVIMSFKSILLSIVKNKVSEEIAEGMEVVNRIIQEMDVQKAKKSSSDVKNKEFTLSKITTASTSATAYNKESDENITDAADKKAKKK